MPAKMRPEIKSFRDSPVKFCHNEWKDVLLCENFGTNNDANLESALCLLESERSSYRFFITLLENI